MGGNELFDAMNREILAGGEPTTVIQRLIDQSVATGLLGDEKVSARLQERYFAMQDAKRQLLESELPGILQRKIALELEFDAAQRASKPPPDITPHPAHIMIRNGELVQAGPANELGRRLWEALKYFAQYWRENVRFLKCEIASATGEIQRDIFQGALANAEKRLRHFLRNVPKEWDVWEKIYTRDGSEEEIRAWTQTAEFKVYFHA